MKREKEREEQVRQETYKNEYNKDHKRGLSAKSLFCAFFPLST